MLLELVDFINVKAGVTKAEYGDVSFTRNSYLPLLARCRGLLGEIACDQYKNLPDFTDLL